MRELIRRHSFTVYYSFAWVIALGVMAGYFVLMLGDPSVATLLPAMFPWMASHQLFTNIYAILRFAADGHAPAVLILVFAAAPSMAALAVTWITSGGAGVAALLRRYLPMGPDAEPGRAKRAWAVIIGLYVFGLAVFGGALRLAAPPADIAAVTAHLGQSPGLIALVLCIAPFLDEGGLLEELGWRGFALPRLQARMASPLMANLWLGALWMAWHLPREIPTLLSGPDWGLWLMNQARFLLLTMSLSVIAGWLVNQTGGSVLPAILLHGGTNVWSKAITPAEIATGIDLRAWIVVPLAVLIAVLAGRNLGRVQPPAGAGQDA